MKKAMREIFSDTGGRLSSKRIFGALSFFATISITVWVLVTDRSVDALIYPYTLTGGLFGFGVFEKRK